VTPKMLKIVCRRSRQTVHTRIVLGFVGLKFVLNRSWNSAVT